jgi:hypothetical protein
MDVATRRVTRLARPSSASTPGQSRTNTEAGRPRTVSAPLAVLSALSVPPSRRMGRPLDHRPLREGARTSIAAAHRRAAPRSPGPVLVRTALRYRLLHASAEPGKVRAAAGRVLALQEVDDVLEETIEILADADTMRRLHASDAELARGDVETQHELDAAMQRRRAAT